MCSTSITKQRCYRSRLSLISHIIIILSILIIPNTTKAVGLFDDLDVFPGVVPTPYVMPYDMCVSRYVFCSCRLTGLVDESQAMQFDANEDGVLQSWEIEQAIREDVFSEEILSDSEKLACGMDVPSPGPYPYDVCVQRFGENDCICASRSTGTQYCYSRTVAMMSQGAVRVSVQYCKTVNGEPGPHGSPNAFDCLCGNNPYESKGLSYYAQECTVVFPPREDFVDCLDIRLFTGVPFACVEKVTGLCGLVFGTKCCPNAISCELDIDGMDWSFLYRVAAVKTAELAISYYGFTTSPGFTRYMLSATDIAHPAEEFLKKVVVKGEVGHYFKHGVSKLTGLGFETVSQIVSVAGYVGLAWTALQILSNILCMTGVDIACCTEKDYMLACKVRTRTCLFVGDCKDDCKAGPFVVGKIKRQLWICYKSQIARIINEYGLPQIHAPGCHRENCDASGVHPLTREVNIPRDACGCRNAYAINGDLDCDDNDDLKESARANGFSLEEFQRLDFSQIPLGEELAAQMLASVEEHFSNLNLPSNLQELSRMWEDSNSPLLTPSALDVVAGRSSVSEEIENLNVPDQQQTVNFQTIGGCPTEFPFQTTREYPVHSAFEYRVCIAPPSPDLEIPGKIYLYFYPIEDNCYSCIVNGIYPDLPNGICTECSGPALADMSGTHYSICRYENPPHERPEPIHPKLNYLGLYFHYSLNVISWHNSCISQNYLLDKFYENVPIFKNPTTTLSHNFSLETALGNNEIVMLQVSNDAFAPESIIKWNYILMAYYISETGLKRAREMQLGRCFAFIPSLTRITNFICNPFECRILAQGSPTNETISQQCLSWYDTLRTSLEGVNITEDCNITVNTTHLYGKDWALVINRSRLNSSEHLTQGEDWFCGCPHYQNDICWAERKTVELNRYVEMACPRPTRHNIIQRDYVYYPQELRRYYDWLLQQPEYQTAYCWLDPMVANYCTCN